MAIEKETITTENIIIDCKKQFWASFASSFFMIPLSLLLSIWLIYMLHNVNEIGAKIAIWIVLPVSLLLFFLFTFAHIYSFKKYRAVFQKKFEIKTDKLVHKEDQIISPPGRIYKKSRPCSLQFSKYGDYSIYSGTNYHSSKHYKMWYDELFRSSKIGDEFYLAVDDKNNILIVYNTKFFNLQEQ